MTPAIAILAATGMTPNRAFTPYARLSGKLAENKNPDFHVMLATS
jgi:hypothetical protein